MSPFRRLLHWGPMLSLTIVGSLTYTTGKSKVTNPWLYVFHLSMCLCLYNMWCATFIGPGYQKTGAESGTISKPATSGSNRFCRRCQHVVLGKHHHCPWINNCVGKHNEHYFKRFLLFAICVTTQASSHIMLNLLDQGIDILNNIFEIFNLGLSIGALIAVAFLLFTH